MSEVSSTGARFGRNFRPGDALFREGDEGDVVYVIQAGAVRVSKRIDGHETTLADLQIGDFVGEGALISGRPHSATAIAVEPTICLMIDGPMLELMVSSNAEIAVRFIKGLSSRLEAANDMLGIVAHRDAPTRVVLALMHAVKTYGRETSKGVRIRRKLVDLARSIAVSEQEVKQVLDKLVAHQALIVDRMGLLVPDVPRLLEFVKFANG